MSEVPNKSEDPRGEAFAFFRWVTTRKISINCYPSIGWRCYFCRESWIEGRR